MKSRFLKKELCINRYSKLGRIIVLTGARQTGKTTLVKNLCNNYQYISIEDPVVVEQLKGLTASQWSQLYPQAILDEVQKVPVFIESIKSVYDQFDKPKYILLGSSQILLLRKIRESLAGRCKILEMFPLTLPEILTKKFTNEISLSYFQNLLIDGDILSEPSILLYGNHPSRIKEFNHFLQFGGLPALYDNTLNDKEKQDWLKDYIKTYLERDIRDLADIRNLEPFTKLLRLLAVNTGQLANYSRLAAEAGVSPKTAQRFIEYMNISYQTVSLQSWSRNHKKRLVKSPKIHFLDPGVMRAVSQKKDPLTGSEFESAIIAEIYKQAKMVNANLNFYHLRTSDGRELDLLIESERGYIAIEIKQTKNVRSVDGRHLREIDAILDKPVLHKFILSNDYHIKDFNNNTTAISAVQFLT